MKAMTAPLVTFEGVIAESCYLLRHLRGAAEAVLENVATGVFQIPFQLSRSTSPLQHIFSKYRDRKIDFADACMIHLASELKTAEVLTLDRDFGVYRWCANHVFHPLIVIRRPTWIR